MAKKFEPKDCADPYLEGYDAMRRGEEDYDNPYDEDENADEHALWNDGFSNVIKIDAKLMDEYCSELFGSTYPEHDER